MDHLAARIESHEPKERVLGPRRARVLFGEDATGVGSEVEVARAEVSGGEFVEQLGGDGVAEGARHLNDLSEGRRLAAAMMGELTDNFDLFRLFGVGWLIGRGTGCGFEGGGLFCRWGGDRRVVARLGDFFGEGEGLGVGGPWGR